MQLYSVFPSLQQNPGRVVANVILCIGLLRGLLFLLTDSSLSLVDRIPADFHSQMFMWVPLPGSGALGWGAWLEVESPLYSGGPFAAKIIMQNIPLESQLPPMGVGPVLFSSLPFLPFLMWLLL